MSWIINLAVTALAVYAAVTGNVHAVNATAVAAWLFGIMFVLAAVVIFCLTMATCVSKKIPVGEKIKEIQDLKRKTDRGAFRKWFNRIMPSALLVSCAVSGYVATAIFFGLMWIVISIPVAAMAKSAMDKFLLENATHE